MYKELREIRFSLSQLEGRVKAIAAEENISLEKVLDELYNICVEDCGEYQDKPQVGLYLI